MMKRLRHGLVLKASGPHYSSHWINEDLRPLPISRRTWGTGTFVSFWAINSLIPTNFTVGSTLVGYGLSVWQAMIAVVIGKVIVVAVAVLNGWVGAEWHIGFSVISRYVWGMYGSYVILAQRILLSCVWMACQGWTGGLCVSTVLSAIFPAYHGMNNTLPASAHMETKEFIGFVIFCLLTCCVLWIRPEKLRTASWVMNLVAAITMTGITLWALFTAHGAGPLLLSGPKVRGTHETAWAIVQGVTSVIGEIAVGLSNQPDYSRFATKLGDQLTGQVVSIPIIGVIIPFFGCLTASATQQIYGEVIWNPPILLNKWIETRYNAASRAGAVIAGIGLIVTQLGINLVDNAYSGGMDLAGLLPRFINIRRGAYLTLCISILLQPWQLLSSASVFISVLSAYSVFLGPLMGIMITDYWLIRHRRLKLGDLYRSGPDGIYWFWHGYNPRAFLAWLCGWGPMLPGFIAHINSKVLVPEPATELYYLAFPAGFAISAVVFYAISRLWPAPGLGQVDDFDDFETFTEVELKRHGIAKARLTECRPQPGVTEMMRKFDAPERLEVNLD